MKKIFGVLIIFLPLLSVAQIEIISNDATKNYPDGTRISYLTLSDYPTERGFLDFVNSSLTEDKSVIRFFLYKDGTKCFLESQQDFTDDMLINAINEAYQNYFSSNKPKQKGVRKKTIPGETKIKSEQPEEGVSVRSFSKSNYNGEFYTVGFKLINNSDPDVIKAAVQALKEQGGFENIKVNNTEFELSSYKPINAESVISTFDEFGLEIEDRFIN